MALLKIARMGHPVLLERAAPVEDPRAAEIARLVADMIETMDDAGGIGLAAPQVHVLRRLFVFRLPARAGEAREPAQVVINPTVEPIGEASMLCLEGCLSIPGLRARVPRHAAIRYQGVDGEGRVVEREAQGIEANVVQHEYDHLDGVLYPMRVTDFRSFGFTEELARFAPAKDAP